MRRQKVMLKTPKFWNPLCQRQKTWSCLFSKAKGMVLPYVKTAVALPAWAFKYTDLPVLYSSMPKTKFYTKMQSRTTKFPFYHTCDVFAIGTLIWEKLFRMIEPIGIDETSPSLSFSIGIRSSVFSNRRCKANKLVFLLVAIVPQPSLIS